MSGDRPTPARFQAMLYEAYAVLRHQPPHDREETLLDACVMRWTGVYVVLYTGEEPSHVRIFGYSGD